MAAKPLRAAPQDYASALALEQPVVLPHFTALDAFNLGIALRTRIRALSTNPAVISITAANSDNLLFHATTQSHVTPDNDIWVARKRATVKRWGVSSWAVGRKFDGDEAVFARKLMLGDGAGRYAIHGGGVPVRVKGVEGIVGVVVVSGLKQEDDHMVVLEGLEGLMKSDGGEEGGEVDVGVGDGDVNDPAEDGAVGGGEEAEASTEAAKVMVEEQKADGAVLAS